MASSSVPGTSSSVSSLPARGIVLAIIVAALGYFVDIYDLLLLSIIRDSSLASLGFNGKEITRQFEQLMTVQMTGLLTGGILWGVLGDRRGRLSVLFGSILMYSLANIANAFVTSIPQYAALRFVAGVGLAGELGAGITLVAELMSKEKRGYGATIVAAFGLLGAVTAGFIGRIDFGLAWENWRIAFCIGGGMGLLLLLLRIGVFESGMFQSAKASKVRRGDFRLLLTNRRRLWVYLCCILIGIPVWYMVGILVMQAREFSAAAQLGFTAENGIAVMCCYAGLSAGDLASGLLSQLLGSRRRALAVFWLLCLVSALLYLNLPGKTPFWFYAQCVALGFSAGYWAVFVTVAAEQFGTNIRATVATTVPNFVRGSLSIIILIFVFFRDTAYAGQAGGVTAAAHWVALLVFSLSAIGLWYLPETFGRDLDYVEAD